MTDQPTDPAATFRLDQEEARSEQETRDKATWDHQVRMADANAAMLEASAAWRLAQAHGLVVLTATAPFAILAAVVRLLRRPR